MNIFWKGAAVLGLTLTGIGATAVPAQAQYYGDRDGWRGDRDGGRDSRWERERRWEHRRDWRDERRWRRHSGYNPYYGGYRQRCWNEWRYDRYADRRVRIRICR